MPPTDSERFAEHLRRRHYSRHTVESYALDLRLFFATIDDAPASVTWRDVDRFVAQQHAKKLAPTTINRRLNTIKVFFDYLIVERETLLTNPVKPSHYVRQGKALPKKLTTEQVKRLFSRIDNEMDRALFLLMLRCGLRVGEAARLKAADVDWEQQALLVEQSEGRKDRRLYVSPDALASLKQCLEHRPEAVPGDRLFWNQKRKHQPLSIKAIQKKMERYTRAAGMKASCHWLRHTFASNLLEEGAEVISIKEFLGHESVAASERYARLSNQKIKQKYMETIKKVIAKTRV